MTPEDQAKVLEKCNRESSAFYAASRMWNDGIVLPEDTRQVNDIYQLCLTNILFCIITFIKQSF
jgi:acetyl-CoA carboxylase carboxyltransferase component